MSDMTPADVYAMTRNNDGDGNGWGGNGGWLWIIVLFIFAGGWGGGWGGNRNGDAVTEAGLCNAMNFNNLENAVGRISDTQQMQFMQLNNGMCNLGYSALQQTNETQRQIADCCCTTKQLIAETNYNNAMNTAAINANTTAGVQKILDKMCEQETQALRDRIATLERNEALCGVVRYPQSITYGAGCSPFWNNGGCCGTSF